jgi:hypothetical protein
MKNVLEKEKIILNEIHQWIQWMTAETLKKQLLSEPWGSPGGALEKSNKQSQIEFIGYSLFLIR